MIARRSPDRMRRARLRTVLQRILTVATIAIRSIGYGQNVPVGAEPVVENGAGFALPHETWAVHKRYNIRSVIGIKSAVTRLLPDFVLRIHWSQVRRNYAFGLPTLAADSRVEYPDRNIFWFLFIDAVPQANNSTIKVGFVSLN